MAYPLEVTAHAVGVGVSDPMRDVDAFRIVHFLLKVDPED
jgi:hypothetical protein